MCDAYNNYYNIIWPVHRVRKRRCPLAPDKWFWPVDNSGLSILLVLWTSESSEKKNGVLNV